ncbi:MAG: hypothetical protein K0Q59_5839 [Paenibacillus sp.]|nr:hypothetical protein [Paenibacillus sp.]
MHIEKLIHTYPELAVCEEEIGKAYRLLRDCYRSGGKVLVCGNGGSAADCEHIVGELMKGFRLRRDVPQTFRQSLLEAYAEDGRYLAEHLQGALPAISLPSHVALMTAFANDVSADLAFAQQVYGYGARGDVLIGLSTSGNSRNVIHAMQVARLKGLSTIGFAGAGGGRLVSLCDAAVCVPYTDTADVQERHLPVYHTLCTMLEEAFFGS